MKSKKIINIAELVLLIITFVMANLPIFIHSEDWKESLFALLHNYVFELYPLYFYFIIIVIMCVLSFLAKEGHKDSVFQGLVPILLFFALNYALFAHSSDGVTVKSLFPIAVMELFTVGVIVLGFVKRASVFTGTQHVQTKASASEELMRYKELLDAGAITQEEFDKKKKEILK